MTTPPQEKLTIETPFGTAEIRDARFYEDHLDRNPTLARIYFENGLTVNRKEYDRGVSFELQRPTYRMGEVPYSITSAGYNYRELTDSARDKVRAWFEHEDRHEIFAPYLEPLDEAEIRRQIKSSLHSNIASELHKQESNGRYPASAHESGLIRELMSEVLRDALAWVESGKSFSRFYFDGNTAKAGQ